MEWTQSDRAQFDQWVRDVHEQLLRVIQRFSVPKDQADDIVQDVLLGVLMHWKELDSFEKFRAFCIARARWRVLDTWRDRTRGIDRESSRDAGLNAAIQAAPAQLAGAQDAETFVQGRELMKAIDQLPERSRQVMLLSVRGMTSAEIAQELKIEPASVRSLLRYARFQLASREEIDGELP